MKPSYAFGKIVSYLIVSLTTMNLSNTALAGGAAFNSTLNAIRMGAGMVLGYSTRANYIDLVCSGVDPGTGKACDGPPENGMVGTFATVANSIKTIFSAQGITSCDAIPSSGSYTFTDTNGGKQTLKIGTPTHKVPTNWLNGGALFEHRVTFPYPFNQTVNINGTSDAIVTDLTFAVEFNCGDGTSNPPSYVAVSMPVFPAVEVAAQVSNMTQNGSSASAIATYKSSAAGYWRDIALFTGPISSTVNGIEAYMAEHNTTLQTIRAADAIRIEFNPTTQSYQLWGMIDSNVSIQSQQDGGNYNLFGKTMLNGNYATGLTTVFHDAVIDVGIQNDNFQDINTTAVSATNFPSMKTDTIVGVTTSATDSLGASFTDNLADNSEFLAITYGEPKEIVKTACVQFPTASQTASASAGACTGAALENPSSSLTGTAPLLDASGIFSVNWAIYTMPSKLEALGR